jgi:hypothetical protein
VAILPKKRISMTPGGDFLAPWGRPQLPAAR